MGLDRKILFCPLNYLSIIELYPGFFLFYQIFISYNLSPLFTLIFHQAQNLGCVPCLYAPLCLFLSHHSGLHIRLMSLHPKCKPIENRKYIICYCYVYIFSAHKGQSIKCPLSKNVSPLDYKDLKRIYHVLSIFAYLLNELERINNLATSFTNHGNFSSPINSFL